MADAIDELVIPAFDDLKLGYRHAGDAVFVPLYGKAAVLDVVIRSRPSPLILWIRFNPHFYVDSQKTAVLETALAFNYTGWLVKVGRDPRDGEIVFDLDLLLFETLPSVSAFSTLFLSVARAIDDYTELLFKARWASLTPLQAISSDQSDQTDSSAPPKPRRRRKTRVEREVDHLLKSLDEDANS